jgi:hypothetical protein
MRWFPFTWKRPSPRALARLRRQPPRTKLLLESAEGLTTRHLYSAWTAMYRFRDPVINGSFSDINSGTIRARRF